jgi:hypothetical protein
MANICNNTLLFSGKPKNLKAVREIFEPMLIDNENGYGAIPSFIANVFDGYMFDIYLDKTDYISYWTKWCPNEDIIKRIADKYEVDFILDYEELGCGLFGRFHYNHKTKQLIDYCLTDDEMSVVDTNDNGDYIYNGEEIECPEDIYTEILNQKIKNN